MLYNDIPCRVKSLLTPSHACDMRIYTLILWITCWALPLLLQAAVLNGLDQDAKGLKPLDSKPNWDQTFDKTIGHLMLQAGQAFESGNIREALRKVQEAKRRMPLNNEVKLALAHVLLRLNRVEDALEHLYTLLSNDPKNPGYLRLVGYCYESLGQYDEALEIYDRFSRVVRSSEKPEMYKGGVYFQMGKVDEAIKCYSRAVTRNPDTPVTHEALGAAWLKEERYNEAIVAFEKAIKLDPSFARAYNSLGTAFFRTERYQEGMEQVRRAIQIDAGYAQAYNNLGGMLALRKQPHRALDQFSHSLELNLFSESTWQNTLAALDQVFPQVEGWELPSPPESVEDPANWHRKEASTYTEGNDMYKAVRHLMQAIRLAPNTPMNYNNLGAILASTDAAGVARHFFQVALSIDPGYQLASDNFNKLKQKYGKAMGERRKVHLKKKIAQDPTNTGAFYQLGLLYAQQGDLTNAVPCLVHAIDLAPTNVLVRLAFSRVLYNFGEGNSALEALLSTLELDITSRAAWGQLLQALGFMIKQPQGWELPQPTTVTSRFEYAVWHYEQALTYDLNQSNEWTKAASHVYASLLQYPELTDTFDLMGQITAKHLSPRIAVPFFRFALVLSPGPAVQQRLDMALDGATRERRDAHRRTLVQKLKADPNDAQAAYLMGIDLAQQGQLDKALLFFKRAYKLQPDDRDTAYKYGRALFTKGAKGQALSVLDKLLQTEPENPILLFRVAWLLVETQPSDTEAIERAFLLNRLAIEKAKPHVPAEIYQNLAHLHYIRGQKAEARAAIQQAIEAAGKSGSNVDIKILEQAATRYAKP